MKTIFKICFGAYLLFQFGFSFYRYYQFPLDGDLAVLVLPDKWHQTVFDDPFGLNVLLHDSTYSSTNRFFAVWGLSKYFKNVPLWLQAFTTPINSLYASCALAKTVIHFGLLFLIAFYITGKTRLWDFDTLLMASLVSPLFQTYGYNMEMGIIDHSVTYTFFYALALLLVMLFFFSFFLSGFHQGNNSFNVLKTFLLMVLAAVISFHGPLNSAVILIICSSVLLHKLCSGFSQMKSLKFSQRLISSIKKIPSTMVFIFSVSIVLCLYSLYIGKNNSENLWSPLSISERYSKLFYGFYKLFTEHLGPGLLVLMIIINVIIIKKNAIPDKYNKYILWIKWGLILSVAYILLLPFGGYREYRPNILRYDTFMPVTIVLILSYGLSTYHILKEIKLKRVSLYISSLILFSLIFINADAEIKNENTCDRESLEQIANSPDMIVELNHDCWFMSWGKTTNYLDSEINCDMLRYWRVVKGRKYFYQK